MYRLADSSQRLMEHDTFSISVSSIVTKKVFQDHQNFWAVPKELRELDIYDDVFKYIAI